MPSITNNSPTRNYKSAALIQIPTTGISPASKKHKQKIIEPQIKGLKFEHYSNRKDIIDEKKIIQYNSTESSILAMDTAAVTNNKAVDFEKYTERKGIIKLENIPSPGHYKPKFDFIYTDSNKTCKMRLIFILFSGRL